MKRHRSTTDRVGRIGVSLATVSLLLGTGLTTAAQARSSAAQPARGGSESVWLGATAPDCLDPQKTGESASNGVDNYVFDGLLTQDAKGRPTGDLATSFKTSNAGKRITFQLRKGVKFSNGHPFDASAVKYTFDRALNPATKSPVTASLLAQVASTKILNKYAVQINLSSSFRPFLDNLEGGYTGILDPKVNTNCEKPVGTGPYKIQSVGPAFSTVTVVANKYHTWAPKWIHNQKGVPYITTVNFKVIASDATAISELQSGGIDEAAVPGTQLSRIKGNKNIALHTVPTQGEDFLEFNTASAPFNTVAARKAVAELIDRAAIVKAAYAGQAKPVYSPLPPTIPYYAKTAAKSLPHLNVSDAAKIIQANHLTGPYNLLVPAGGASPTEAEILQAAAAQAGMKLNIVTKALADFIPAAAKGEFDMLLLTYGYNDPDVLYLLLNSSQGGGKGLNFTNYVNPTLDQLLVKGRETLKGKTAQKAYSQAQALVNKEVIFVGLVIPTSILAFRSSIKGYHVNRQYTVATQDLYTKTK